MKQLLFLVVCATVAAGTSAGEEPEFSGHCAMSMSIGVVLPTDCSIFWISRDDKLYCFTSQQARSEFIESPDIILGKARATWEDPAFWERHKLEHSGKTGTH